MDLQFYGLIKPHRDAQTGRVVFNRVQFERHSFSGAILPRVVNRSVSVVSVWDVALTMRGPDRRRSASAGDERAHPRPRALL